MPWETPTLGEVRRLVRDDIAAHLPGADATIPNSVLRVLADANAGLATLVLQYIDWLSRQFLPDTAEKEWLDRHGRIWVGGRKAATYAEGSIALTGIEGVVVPVGTRLVVRSTEYETTEEITLGDAGTPVAVRAILPGVSGNQPTGTGASVSLALSGLDGTAEVITLAGGAEAESDDSLRERVLFRIQRPPMGGDADDYVAWTRALPGVTRAWCAPNEMGVGAVTIRFMMDDLRAGSGGYPNESDLAAVRAALDLARPVTVKDLFVEAPVSEPVSFTISNLDHDTPAVRAAVIASVRALIAEKAAPGHALNGVLQPAQTIYREWVSSAILAAPGVESFDLVMDDHVMPHGGAMAELGTVVFV